VDVKHGVSWDTMRVVAEFQRLQASLDVEDPDMLDRYIAALNRISFFIADRIVGWTWTDDQGEPLPLPTAEVVEAMDTDEVQYLLTVITRAMPGKTSSTPPVPCPQGRSPSLPWIVGGLCAEFNCRPSDLSPDLIGPDGEDLELLLEIVEMRRYTEAFQEYDSADNTRTSR